jgi:NAD(P)-dependent dehydrogenase (short-subunit alcohol dehydrogenase family)
MGFLEDRANLTGKTAVVVGGGGGLGRACALDLARAGVTLALCDRNEALLAESRAMAEETGAHVVDAVFDARDADAMAAFFAQRDEAHGDTLDILVNVVGGTFRQPFAESSPRGWDALIRTNFTWLLQSTHLAIPRMRAAGGGSIINLTSIEGHRAAPGFAVYAGMKAGVLNFTRTLAVELAPEHIRVNTIAPDMVPTEGILANAHNAAADATWGDDPVGLAAAGVAIPMGRRGTYEDVGSCALFLASDLSQYVTGTSLHPDGGALASSGWFNWPGVGYRNVPPRDVVAGVLQADEG